ncbi:MAG: hypothetical protein SGJ27_12785 [Candidatus Melainabacteria bacterium]|nr:hypothetical protein [Candidatus Melainabacteria bacterium]
MPDINLNSVKVVEVTTPSAQSRSKVSISRADLDWASSQGLLPADHVSKLWQALVARTSSESKFDLVNLAYYGGASIVLIAMAIFMALITAEYQAPALVGTSVVYGAAFIALGSHLFFRKGLEVPGGLMFTLAVSLTPVLLYGIMSLNGIASLTSSTELVIEIATVVAAVVALSFVRFPFLTMPLFAALWFMSITVTSMVGNHGGFFWGDNQLIVSMIFGVAMSAISFSVDRRTAQDYSYWGYLFGVTSFWLSLTFLDKGGQLGMLAYFGVNVVLMLASVLLQRRIFLAAGALGSTGYLMYLAYDIFENSMAFPIVLSLIGLGVIFLGISYHKNKQRVDNFILQMLPSSLTRSLPHNR